MEAELTFQNRNQANEFARAWAFKSLMGHTISKNTVKIYNITPELKIWIDDYVLKLNGDNHANN